MNWPLQMDIAKNVTFDTVYPDLDGKVGVIKRTPTPHNTLLTISEVSDESSLQKISEIDEISSISSSKDTPITQDGLRIIDEKPLRFPLVKSISTLSLPALKNNDENLNDLNVNNVILDNVILDNVISNDTTVEGNADQGGMLESDQPSP